MSRRHVVTRNCFLFMLKMSVLLAFVVCLTPREAHSSQSLYFQNSSNGKVVYWSLDSTGRLKNRIQGEGWDFVSCIAPGYSWRLVGIQLNADTQQRTHLLWKDTAHGKLNYWALNSNGTLANTTRNEGWGTIGILFPTWRVVGVQYNGDRQGNTQLVLSNDAAGKVVYWKLDSNGKLMNGTRGSGWNYVNDTSVSTRDLRLVALQQNADSDGNDHLLWENRRAGLRIYWKLNSNGTLANRTRGDGWDYLTTSPIPMDWQIVGVQKNADKQNHDHLLQYNNASGYVSYWKLNSTGVIANTTRGDGWDYLADIGYRAPWTIASIHPNADGQNGDHLIWQNRANGKLVYWKLDNSGKLKNKTKDDGWGYITEWQPAPSWRVRGVGDDQ